MDNAKGETRFESGGKGYILKFTFNAFCDLEDAFDMSIQQILKKLEASSKKGDFSLRDMRTMMLYGLKHFHSEIDIKQAGQIIDGFPSVGEAFNVISSAFILGFGSVDEKSKKGVGAAEPTS